VVDHRAAVAAQTARRAAGGWSPGAERYAGDDYTIADIAAFPWYGNMVPGGVRGGRVFFRAGVQESGLLGGDDLGARASAAGADREPHL